MKKDNMRSDHRAGYHGVIRPNRFGADARWHSRVVDGTITIPAEISRYVKKTKPR